MQVVDSAKMEKSQIGPVLQKKVGEKRGVCRSGEFSVVFTEQPLPRAAISSKRNL